MSCICSGPLYSHRLCLLKKRNCYGKRICCSCCTTAKFICCRIGAHCFLCSAETVLVEVELSTAMSMSLLPLFTVLLPAVICMHGHAQCSIFIQALQLLNTAKQSQLSAPAHNNCAPAHNNCAPAHNNCAPAHNKCPATLVLQWSSSLPRWQILSCLKDFPQQ